MFTSVYLPRLKPGETDPTRSGWPTRDDAWDYIQSQVCPRCRQWRELGVESPPCTEEWGVVSTSWYEGCQNFEEVWRLAEREKLITHLIGED